MCWTNIDVSDGYCYKASPEIVRRVGLVHDQVYPWKLLTCLNENLTELNLFHLLQ